MAATALRLSAQKALKKKAPSALAAGLKNQALQNLKALETTLSATAKDQPADNAAADLAPHAKEEKVRHLVAAKDAQARLATEEKAARHLVVKDAHLVAAKDARLARHLAAKENLTPKAPQEDLLAAADLQARKNAGSKFYELRF